ncbi:uncharacterized protein Blos3 isoform X2 [Diabrotica undecimpunctata]|uniref:uncharacterized protein Blos3 isoform X2 n=1 Tax=Diabrotica undecimpunctata TaxID=50387 RepID=UPI003B640848
MNKSVVITGEASETDSEGEDEVHSNTLNSMTKTVQGAVITGEDSESDTEIDSSVASVTSALNQKELLEVNATKFNSLFHQKLSIQCYTVQVSQLRIIMQLTSSSSSVPYSVRMLAIIKAIMVLLTALRNSSAEVIPNHCRRFFNHEIRRRPGPLLQLI